jgi:hypothetical protein
VKETKIETKNKKKHKNNMIQVNKQLTVIKLEGCKLVRKCKRNPCIKKRKCIKKIIIKRIKRNLVQDCLEFRWLVNDSTSVTIYQANKKVAASGVIDFSSATTGITQVTIRFLNGATEVTQYTVNDKQSLAFTVYGFDTITLTGNGVSAQDSATGSFSLTPRYEV